MNLKFIISIAISFCFGSGCFGQKTIQDSTELFDNGTIKSISSLIEGKAIGIQCEFFKNGKIKGIKYSHGEYKFEFWFYETGVPKGECVSRNGNTLIFRKYDEMGVLGYEETYDDSGHKEINYYKKQVR